MILIFDLFQTLVEVENMDFNLGLKPFWNEHYKDKCSFDEIKAYGEELFVRMTDLHKSGFEFPFVKDELPLYAERFGGDPVNMNIEDEALFLSRCNKVRVCDGLREMLDILAEREIPMYVLSNSGFRADALHLMLDSNGIGRYFNRVWSSADFGKVKPSAELFNMSISEVLSQHPDASKEDIWFIGDTYETDIIGAHNAGLRTVWINRDNAAGDKGVATHQIRDITDLWKTDLALLPPCFNEIKEAILSGTGYWYPLSGKESTLKPAAYSLDKIYRDGRIDLLKSILEKAEITEVTAFHPFWHEHSRGSKWKVIADMKSYICERDDTGYNFPWIDETYYFDKSGSRIIYVSHEGTITFAGERLSGIPEAVIPDTYKINRG